MLKNKTETIATMVLFTSVVFVGGDFKLMGDAAWGLHFGGHIPQPQTEKGDDFPIFQFKEEPPVNFPKAEFPAQAFTEVVIPPEEPPPEEPPPEEPPPEEPPPEEPPPEEPTQQSSRAPEPRPTRAPSPAPEPRPMPEPALLPEALEVNFGQPFVGDVVSGLLPEHRKILMGEDSGGSAGEGSSKRWSGFVAGRFEDIESKTSVTQSDLTGITIGADVLLSDTTAAGAFLDFGQADIEGRMSDEEVDEYSVAGFFLWLDPKFDARLAVRYGRQDIENTRTTATGGVSRGNLDGTVWDMNAGFNYYLMQPSETLPGVTLLSSLTYFEVERDSYIETGSTRRLQLDEATYESLIGDLGVEVYKPISTSWGVVSPVVSFSWQHQFEDDPVVLSGVSATGNPLVLPTTVTSRDVDKNWFRGNLGVTLIARHGWSGFFDVNFDLGRDDFERTLFTIGLRKEFGN